MAEATTIAESAEGEDKESEARLVPEAVDKGSDMNIDHEGPVDQVSQPAAQLKADEGPTLKRGRDEDEGSAWTEKKKARGKSCEPAARCGGLFAALADEDAPLVEPESSEVRLLQLVDSSGALLSGLGEKTSGTFGSAKVREASTTTKAVFLLVLRRSGPGELANFVDKGGLRPLGEWLEQSVSDGADLASLVVDALRRLPVTKRAIRSSGVGKVIKRLRDKNWAGVSEACASLMTEWVKAVGDEKVDESPPVEAKPPAAATRLSVSTARASDPLAVAFVSQPASTRSERAELRRSGRGGGGVQELPLPERRVVVDEEDEDDDFSFLPSPSQARAKPPPQSRPFDPKLGNLLERARLREQLRARRVHWADEGGRKLVEAREPVPGWLETAGLDDDTHISLAERKRREHEAEKRALEEAKREAAAAKVRADQERLEALRAIKKTRPWAKPLRLQDLPQLEDFNLDSPEASRKQPKRIDRLIEARYLHPRDIPKTPDERDPDLLLGPDNFSAAVVIPPDDGDARAQSTPTPDETLHSYDAFHAPLSMPPQPGANAPQSPPPPAHLIHNMPSQPNNGYGYAQPNEHTNTGQLDQRLMQLDNKDLEALLQDQ